MRLRIRAKLLSGFVVVALFTGALGLYALLTMERLNEEQRTMYVDVFGGTDLLANYADNSWQARSDLLGYLLTEDPAERDLLRQEIATIDAKLKVLVQEMDEADTDRQDVQTLAGLEGAWNAYATWRDQSLFRALDAGDRAGALNSYHTQGIGLAKEVDQAIDAFLDKKHEVAGDIETSAEATYDSTRTIAIGLSVTAVGFGLLIGFFLSRSIATAARQMARAAKGLARGKVDQEIAVRSRDEIGEMAEAFREMIAYQQEMARVANAMADSDLSQDVHPKAASDVLGTAFQRMTRNLRTLVGQLEDAVRARDEFLSIAAHELRTPVTAIKAAAQLMGLMQASGSPDPTRLARVLRNLEDGAEQLGRLTEDLLDVSRLRTGRLQLRLAPLDLVVLSQRVLAAPGARLGGGPRLELEVDAAACEVLADEARVEQVVTNLLDNAVKYSPDGGVVRIAVRAEGEGCLVRVQDQGIGLPPGATEKIFEPFGRAANAQERQIQGMGLGLYISRQIAESHGGQLWADSAGENRGTTMSLWLPAHAFAAHEEHIDDRAAEARAGSRG
jgi:signal transduction histidine kinase